MAMSETLGIRPWEQRELMTVQDTEQAIAYLDAAAAAAEKDPKGG